MKKWINYFLGILLVFGLSACTSSNVNTQEAIIDNQQQENNSNKILIVYFSMPETSSSTDMSSEEENSTVVIDNEVMGNTHGGSGFSNTIETIKELEPAAIVSNQGLSISRNEIENSKSTIISWLDALAKN